MSKFKFFSDLINVDNIPDLNVHDNNHIEPKNSSKDNSIKLVEKLVEDEGEVVDVVDSSDPCYTHTVMLSGRCVVMCGKIVIRFCG